MPVSRKEDQSKPEVSLSDAAAALGRKGGLKGGPSRAKSLTKERRREIAEAAAKARWSKKKPSKK